jgi:hypothetical protein
MRKHGEEKLGKEKAQETHPTVHPAYAGGTAREQSDYHTG